MTAVMEDLKVAVTGSRSVPQHTVHDIVRAYWKTTSYETGTGFPPDDIDRLLVCFDPESDADRDLVHRGVEKGLKVIVLGSDGILPVEAVPAPVEIPEQRDHEPEPESASLIQEMLALGRTLISMAEKWERQGLG